MERKSVGFEQLVGHLRLPRDRQDGGRLLSGARHRAHHLADRAGPLQGLHLDAEAERLSLDPHDRDRARTSSASNCRSAPGRCTRSPNTASPRTRSTRTAPGRRPRCCRANRSAYAWLRRTIELLAEGSNPEEFLEHTKLELFHDQVFCFTPKGKLIALPRRATPIDFAYAVHTDVGNTAVGCKINGKIAPLVSELRERRRGRDHDLEGADSAAGRLGIAGRHRQGARRRSAAPPARPCATSMPGSVAASSSGCVSAPRSPIRTRSCRARCRGSRARRSRTCIAAVGRGEMRAVRRGPRDVSRLQGRARRRARSAAQEESGGWFGLKRAKAVKVKLPEADGGKRGHSDPRHQQRPAGAVRAQRRRGAGRPDRRHPDAGRGHHDLSDPVAGAEGFRGHAGALARLALGCGGSHAAAVPGPHHACRPSTSPASLVQVAQVIAEHDGNIDNIRMTRQSPDFTDAA